MRALEGKAAIVTGAGDGIGLGIARRFAKAGAKVLVAEINEMTGEAAITDIDTPEALAAWRARAEA